MIISRQGPCVNSFKIVSFPVSVGVCYSGKFAALRTIKSAILIHKTEYLVQAGGKLPEIRARAGRIFKDIDVSPAGGERQVAIGNHGQSADLEQRVLRR